MGQWEKIVDAPVLLRSLDAELGDRFLQVLEQIVEVLEVLPEEIASQLKVWGSEERIFRALRGADCRLVRPAGHGVCRDAVGVRRGADYGIPCASVLGGARAPLFLGSACRIVRWSRLRIPLCLSSWGLPWKLCLLHHRSACKIVLGSSSLMCQCPTSRRKLPGRSSALVKCSLCLTHRDDHACSDNVGFIKGLDKFNMPRLGDVMVREPQITQGLCGPCGASGFLVR